MKIYTIPTLSDTAIKLIEDNGYVISRNSKNVVTLGQQGKLFPRGYTFHLNFDTGVVEQVNIKERCSGYKDVTLRLKMQELHMVIEVERSLNSLLAAGDILENKVEVE